MTKSVETADLVGFTEGILNGKLNFLRSVKCDKIISSANWCIEEPIRLLDITLRELCPEKGFILFQRSISNPTKHL